MSVRARPLDDPHRLAAVAAADLLDTPVERPFERLTSLTARLLRAPVSLVTVVVPERQFFKSGVGLPEDVAAARETPIEYSFCQHVVTSGAPLVVNDAREDPLVRDNPAVEELEAIAYVGVPLVSSEGYVIGTLCALDHVPRAWTDDDLTALLDLSASVISEIDLRAHVREREERALELNDDVVQDLTAAKLALYADRREDVAKALDSALGATRTIIAELVRGRAPSAIRRRARG